MQQLKVLGTGSLHLDPDEATDHAGGAITFGASDSGGGANAQAGIYVRSDGSYGTKMYFSTTDSYATGSKTAMNILQNGQVNITRSNLLVNTDVRAPIFYDSNDTTYYINPAGANSALFKGVLNFHTTAGNLRGYIQATDTNDEHFIIATSGGEDIAFKDGGLTGGVNMVIRGDGDVLITRNLYARAFYDQDNTGYYTDPSGTSRLLNLDFGAAGYYLKAGDWGPRIQSPYGWIQFGPANTSHAHIYTDRSNFYFNAQIQLLGGSLINQNDIRAQIFYDLNDTNYYCDPNGTSYVKYLGRREHQSGHFVGSYNNIGGNSAKSNPIYTIGSSYNPNETTLADMYGIGYAHPNLWGSGENK